MRKLIIFGIWLLGTVVVLRSIMFGGIPFWFDPARDMLLAVANLSKLTLLGVPTGIPGLNYGPYWVWFLSFATIFSKDPRLASFLVLGVPYLFILPALLFKLRGTFKLEAALAIWLILICNFESYASFIWNPHLAPFLFFLLFFISVKAFTKKASSPLIFIAFGFVAGLIFNFSFAFGIAAFFASFITLIFYRVHLKNFAAFILGAGVAFLPTLIFELRHGFNEVQTLFRDVTNTLFYNTAIVGQHGLSQTSIKMELIGVISKTFVIPWQLSCLIFVLLLALAWKRRKDLKPILLPALTLLILVVILLSSKNPVWGYHTIGIESILLIITGYLVSRFRFLPTIFLFFACLLLIQKLIPVIKDPTPDFTTFSSLASKELVTRGVVSDAGNNPYAVAARDPGIYTYDFDYLFSWLASKNKPSPVGEVKTVYLIIPKTGKGEELDFIHYKTPDRDYKTVWRKTFPDQTLVIKRFND